MSKTSSIKILHCDLQLMIHASESPQKIEEILRRIIPVNDDEWQKIRKKIEKNSLKGHHGNPIQMWRLKLPPRLTRNILTHVLPKIHEDNFDVEEKFAEQFYPEENSLYFRLSKHDILREPPKFKLTEHGDSVRFRIKFQMYEAKKDRPAMVKVFLKQFTNNSLRS